MCRFEQCERKMQKYRTRVSNLGSRLERLDYEVGAQVQDGEINFDLERIDKERGFLCSEIKSAQRKLKKWERNFEKVLQETG